jgi:hypothetical protein
MRSRFVERVLLASAAFACTQCEPASVIAVTTPVDGGSGSLRSAIHEANASTSVEVRIEIPPGTYELTRCGASDDNNARGDLDLTRAASVSIVAPDGGVTIRQTCPGERVLDVLEAGTLTLVGLQITGGSVVATGPGEGASGGGVRALGSVGLQRTVITGNSVRAAAGSAAPAGQASIPGGAARGGGLYVGGALAVDSSSVISLNSATGGAGADIAENNVVPAAGGRAEGGGAYVVASVFFSGGTLSQNTVIGGVGGDGVIPAEGGMARGGGVAQAETSIAPVELQSLVVADNLAQGGESGGIDGAAEVGGPAGAGGTAEGGGIAAAGSTSMRFLTARRNQAIGGSTGDGDNPLFGSGRAPGPPGAALGGALAGRSGMDVNSGSFELNLAISGDTFYFCATPGCFGGPASAAKGGAVFATGPVTLTGARFVDNTARRGVGTNSAGGGAALGGAVAGAESVRDSSGRFLGNAARGPIDFNFITGRGGAISAPRVSLSLTQLETNVATGSGGAVDATTLDARSVTAASNRGGGAGGGAFYVAGDAVIAASRIRQNSVDSLLDYTVQTVAGGAGILVTGTLTISESWVSHNSGRSSVYFSNPRIGTFIVPALFTGGGARAQRIVARAVTFSGNEVVASTLTSAPPLPVTQGVSGGGAIAAIDAAELVNVTLADNHVMPHPAYIGTGYGAPPQGAAMLAGSVALEHATLVDNQGAASIQATSLTAQRSVAIAASTAAVCAAGVVSGASSYNSFSDASCALPGATNTQESAAWLLGPLTETVFARPPVHFPQAGSALIDAIPTTACPTLEDANGTARPQGAGCDIGAAEVRL